MWDCAERKSTGPVRSKPADRPEHVRLPWLVYPVDSSSSCKIDYVIGINNFLNLEGHQNCNSGSKVTTILLKGWIFGTVSNLQKEKECL